MKMKVCINKNLKKDQGRKRKICLLCVIFVAGIVSRLRAGISVLRILAYVTDLFLFQNVRSGDHPTFCLLGKGGSFPRVNLWGREVYNLPPSSEEVKKEWI
jgi:hypothetical protein